MAKPSAKPPSSRKLLLLIVSCATFLALLYAARTIFATGGRHVAPATNILGDDTIDLAKQIEKLGLEAETIIPVHGRIGTPADLNAAMSQRISKKE